MKEGFVKKSLDNGNIEQDLKAINRYTRRPLGADDVYIFSLILCDNEIDRDFERFSVNALEKLAGLFVGKTGIFDHSMKGSDQTARIFHCELQQDDSKITKAGEPYVCLKAKAYIPKTEKNADLITEIDAGIKKEVSVGCCVSNIYCSICKSDMKKGECRHIKGKSYSGQICHGVLDNPTDAYEWSFVAVPAQKRAGVVKSFSPFKGGEEGLTEILSKIAGCKDQDIVITAKDAYAITKHIEKLTQLAGAGKDYLEGLKKDVVRLGVMLQPKISHSIMESVCEKMSIEELKAFKSAFEAAAESKLPPRPQLAKEIRQNNSNTNSHFKI